MAEIEEDRTVLAAEQPTWAVDNQTSRTDQTAAGESRTEQAQVEERPEPTGVENVRYDDVVEQGAPVAPAAPAAPTSNTARGDEPQRLSYVDMYKRLNPYKEPTADELEAERRKQKRESMFSALGDGISALANLYFTTQYAPNAYDGRTGLSARARARFDKLKKDREDNQRQYMDGYLRALAMDEARDDRDRSWRHQLEREAVADERYDEQAALARAKAERDAAMDELRRQQLQGQIDEQQARIRKERIEADYREAYERSRIYRNNRERGDRGTPGEFPVAFTDENGKTYYRYYNTEASARANAAQFGGRYVTTPTRTTSTGPDALGNSQTRESTRDVSTTGQAGQTGQTGQAGQRTKPRGSWGWENPVTEIH